MAHGIPAMGRARNRSRTGIHALNPAGNSGAAQSPAGRPDGQPFGVIADVPGGHAEVRIGREALTLLVVGVIALAVFNVWTREFQF